MAQHFRWVKYCNPDSSTLLNDFLRYPCSYTFIMIPYEATTSISTSFTTRRPKGSQDVLTFSLAEPAAWWWREREREGVPGRDPSPFVVEPDLRSLSSSELTKVSELKADSGGSNDWVDGMVPTLGNHRKSIGKPQENGGWMGFYRKSGWWWLEHDFHFPIYWECHHPNWLNWLYTMFQRDWTYWNHQAHQVFWAKWTVASLEAFNSWMFCG